MEITNVNIEKKDWGKFYLYENILIDVPDDSSKSTRSNYFEGYFSLVKQLYERFESTHLIVIAIELTLVSEFTYGYKEKKAMIDKVKNRKMFYNFEEQKKRFCVFIPELLSFELENVQEMYQSIFLYYRDAAVSIAYIKKSDLYLDADLVRLFFYRKGDMDLLEKNNIDLIIDFNDLFLTALISKNCAEHFNSIIS